MITQWFLSCIYATLNRIPPVVWQVLQVIGDILIFWGLKLVNYVRPRSRILYHRANKEVEDCSSYEEWKDKAGVVDEITGANLWRRNFFSGRYDFRSVLEQYGFLQNALDSKDSDAIRERFSTTGACMLRNFAGIVDRRLFTKSLRGTKFLIESYLEKVIEGLDLLNSTGTPTSFFQRCKLSLGTTALILQGGSLFGMFHLGVIKGLLLQDLVPNVICGSSMGSSVAALFGCLSNKKLIEIFSGDILDTLKKDVDLLKSCGYGNMEQHLNLGTLIQNLIHHGYSQDVYLFIQFVCKHIIRDLTFEEAFQSTGKVLSIVIHPTDKSCTNLLNYVTAPNVLIQSAISCSLGSGVISKNPVLLCKNLDNQIEPFLIPEKVATCKYLAPENCNMFGEDNSSPYQRLTELFNVNNFIISLARPYLAPLVVNDLKHEIKTSKYYYYKQYSDPNNAIAMSELDFPQFDFTEMEPLAFKLKYHLERKLKNIVMMEFRHRMEVLDNLGLLCSWVKRLTIDEKTPRSATEITIVPRIKSLSPTRIIEGQLDNIPYGIDSGERSTWPVSALIKTRCSVEFKLDKIIRERRKTAKPNI